MFLSAFNGSPGIFRGAGGSGGGGRRKGKRLPEFPRPPGKRLRGTEWKVWMLRKDKMEKGAATRPHPGKPLKGLRIKQASSKTQTYPFRNGLLPVRHALVSIQKTGGYPDFFVLFLTNQSVVNNFLFNSDVVMAGNCLR